MKKGFTAINVPINLKEYNVDTFSSISSEYISYAISTAQMVYLKEKNRPLNSHFIK